MKVRSSPSWAASITLMVLGLTLSGEGDANSSVALAVPGPSGGAASASSSSCSQRDLVSGIHSSSCSEDSPHRLGRVCE